MRLHDDDDDDDDDDNYGLCVSRLPSAGCTLTSRLCCLKPPFVLRPFLCSLASIPLFVFFLYFLLHLLCPV